MDDQTEIAQRRNAEGTQNQMTETIKTSSTHSESVSEQEDLSRAIQQSMERQRDEQVRCVRVFDDRYRCNWWVEDKHSNPAFVSTGTIRRSRFLRVTKSGDQLVIEDLGRS